MNWSSVEYNGRLYLVPEFVVDALEAELARNARFVEWMRRKCECCEHANAAGQGVPHARKMCKECCECDGAVNWTISKALLGESA